MLMRFCGILILLPVLSSDGCFCSSSSPLPATASLASEEPPFHVPAVSTPNFIPDGCSQMRLLPQTKVAALLKLLTPVKYRACVRNAIKIWRQQFWEYDLGDQEEMGSGASTSTRICSVQSIDESCDRPRRNGKFCSRISFPVSIDRRPESQRKEDKLNLVKRALNAEAKFNECDSKVKDLEKQLRHLQLRNHELSQEVNWQRQQSGATMNSIPCNVVPNTFDSNSSPESEEEIARLKIKVNELQEANDKLTAEGAIKELKIVELQREIEAYQQQVVNLEELYRNRNDDDCLASVSPTFDLVVPQQPNMQTNATSSTLTQPRKSNLRTVSAFARRPSPSKSPNPIANRPVSSDHIDRLQKNIVVIDRTGRGGRKGSSHSEKRRNSDDSDSDLRDILRTPIRSASHQSPSNKSHDSGFSSFSYTH